MQVKFNLDPIGGIILASPVQQRGKWTYNLKVMDLKELLRWTLGRYGNSLMREGLRPVKV